MVRPVSMGREFCAHCAFLPQTFFLEAMALRGCRDIPGEVCGETNTRAATGVSRGSFPGFWRSWKIWLYCSQMRYGIVLSPQALEDLRDLKADLRSQVRDALETHLRHQPTKTSKARIKRLRGLSRPQYRLRVGGVRVFFDVEGSEVRVLAIVSRVKAEE